MASNIPVRVTTKVGEGDAQKRYSAKKELSVPDSVQEAIEMYGERNVLEAVIDGARTEFSNTLRAKLIAKVNGESVVGSEAEEVSID